MKRILMFGMTDGYGGIETFIMGLYRNTDRKNFEFDFIKAYPTLAYEDELIAGGSEILTVTPRREDFKKHYADLKRIMTAKKYDAVWVNTCTLSSLGELAAAKKAGIPVRIIHAHNSVNTGGKLMGILHTINMHRVDKVATHKFSCSDEASKYFFGGSEGITFIPNGIVLDKYFYSAETEKKIREEFALGDALILGNVSRLTAIKNHKFMLEVLAEVKKKRPDAKLLLCGDGDLREEIENQAKELGIADDVLLLGIRKNINEILQAVDFFVFPSFFEGLPFALVEAQAAGIKCMLSENIDKRTIICDNAAMFGIDDAKVWADYILKNAGYKKRVMSELLETPFNLQNSLRKIEKILG